MGKINYRAIYEKNHRGSNRCGDTGDIGLLWKEEKMR